MPTTTGDFIPEVWSQEIIASYKEALRPPQPRRSKGAQLLRDAALGHPEYPSNMFTDDNGTDHVMTATEVNIRQQYENQAAKAMLRQIDNDMLDTFKYSLANVRIVSS